ncbi:hypothetical protein ACGFI3_46240 [Nonomuraea wenchangensis]|uniref:hypothetical protein n=1 Tax=Nonomuraea wenchangensis TaxID=568860 RepID=UPI00371CCF79
MTTSTLARAAVQDEAQVLALLRQGREISRISDITTWPLAAVRKLAAREHLVVDDSGIPRPAGMSAGQAAITRAGLRELLRAAALSDDPQVKRARAKLEHAAQVLRGTLIEAARRKELRAAAVQQAAEAERQIARLTAQQDQSKAQLDQVKKELARAKATLAKARALLGEPGRRYRPGTDYDTKQARTWAKAHGYGHVLPAAGPYVPDDVIDAMRAQQAAGPDPATTVTPDDPETATGTAAGAGAAGGRS